MTISLYGKVALEAVGNVKGFPGMHPREAWQRAAANLIERISSRKKGCPRSAFLGLCEAGLVKDIPIGNYLNRKVNKAYAVKAYELLKTDHRLKGDKKELWNQVIQGETKAHNGQLDVVIALFEKYSLQEANAQERGGV